MDDRTPVTDVKTRTVIVVDPSARLAAAARLMRQSHVSGLPVVNRTGSLVGIVSEVDIVRDLDRSVGVASPRGLLDLVLGSAPSKGASSLTVCRNRLSHGRVEEVMVRKVVSVRPDDPIRKANRLFRGEMVHRLPVVDDSKRVLGIVTPEDLEKAAPEGRRTHRRGALHPAPVRRGRGPQPDPFADI